MKRTAFATVMALTGVVSVAGAQSLTPTQIARVDSVFAPFDGTGRPGCAVGVGRSGKALYLGGYGMADLQHGLAIHPKSIFHVASVSKQFAAIAVALLAEDGALSLDDPVQKHIPELRDYGTPITLRHLIYHASGIRDHWELLMLAGWRYPVDLFTQEDVLQIAARQEALNFTPNDEYVYSNTGYALLAMTVERVSGKSLKQFSEERMFRPLGMHDTHVHDDHSHVVVGRTSAYDGPTDGEWKISIPQFDTHGATSLFTTVGDLLKWQHNFVTAVVGSRALLRDAETSSILNNGKPSGYGYGISIGTHRGARTTGHGGADAGYRADVVRFPDHDLSVSVLCNFASAVPARYAREVATIVLGDALAPAPERTVGGGVASDADLKRAAGVYRRTGVDNVWRFVVRDAKLRVENFGGAPLEPLGPSRFTAFGLVVEFLGAEDAQATSVRLASSDGSLIDSLVRAPVWSPSATELEAFVGSYWSDELAIGYEIVATDSGLAVRRPKHGTAALTPAYQDVLSIAGAGAVRIVRKGRRVTGFTITGSRVRNVRFVRRP